MRRVNSRSTKEYALKYLSECSWLEAFNFKYLKPELKDDPEIVKIAVKKFGTALKFASERLKDDPEVVEVAVKDCGSALEYASDRLQALGIDGVIELAKEQKRKRQIQRSRIDIKNKKIILEP